MAQTVPVSASALPCWTSFDPPAPHGAPMYQYYLNCGSATVTVCSVYIAPNGQLFQAGGPVTVKPTYYAWWYINPTEVTGRYTTAFCT
ncbi:hypothetical protein ACFO3J_32155 [Streptomyces polygonati]|uniref:Uncharacterized protein n=1 Tax=Streptomyces polygonati TaxID=1617087 RepID=A0ABV8HVI2_9ACTN